jgi:hypothetical protein
MGRNPIGEKRMMRVNIVIAEGDDAVLKRLGNGNRSEGLRELVRLWAEATKADDKKRIGEE